MKLTDVSESDRIRIIEILANDDVYVYNQEIPLESDNGYFVTKLDDDTNDIFYDYSVPIEKIFNELQCIPTSFAFNNDYYKEGDVNTYYSISFEKLVLTEVAD